MNNYEWLVSQKVNSLSCEMNEHACNYVDAKTWIREYAPEAFTDVPVDIIVRMIETNTIWRLQIYPNTPIGFNFWYGSTLDECIEQARKDEKEA